MNIEEFLLNFHPGLSEYCPVTIAEDGSVYDSTKGHMQTMIDLSGDEKILEKIPSESMPLFYLVQSLRCVLVDYENQVYYETLTQAQEQALGMLEKKQLIERNRKVIHGQYI